MQIVEKPFSTFLTENTDHILELALQESFVFSVKESLRCVTVRCMLPSGHIRFVVFDDHRTDNAHGGKPHVCNQWHKETDEPVSYTTGIDMTDASRLQNVLRAVAVMCLTQSSGYNDMKTNIFT